MGDRYILTVKCPQCGNLDDDVWYAPTCGVKQWKCKCGHEIDLGEYTGIYEEDASNRDVIEEIINLVKGGSK